MDKDEKRNIIIAAVLSVAGVVVFWYMRSGAAVYTADPSLTAVPDTSGTANPAAAPNYMSYNVPPYDPGNLPPITTYIGGSPLITNNGEGCCPGCAGDDIDITDNIGSYYGLMGRGGLAGAA